MSDLSEKTRVPIGWLISAVVSAFAVGSTSAVGLAKASEANEKVAKIEEQAAGTREQIHALDKRIQRVEDAVVTLKEIAVELKKRSAP